MVNTCARVALIKKGRSKRTNKKDCDRAFKKIGHFSFSKYSGKCVRFASWDGCWVNKL